MGVTLAQRRKADRDFRILCLCALAVSLFAWWLSTRPSGQEDLFAFGVPKKTVLVRTARQATFAYWAQRNCPGYNSDEAMNAIQSYNRKVNPGHIQLGDKLVVPECK